MTIVRRLARPLIAAPVIAAGLDALRHPGPKVDAVRPLVGRASARLGVPDEPELYLRAAGAAQAGAGLMLATGRLPRASATVVALTLAPTGPTQHAFWQEKDPQTRRAQRSAFLTWLGLLGAALLAAVDTAGRPGLAWRGRHGARHAKKEAARAAHKAEKVARKGGSKAADVLGR